MNSQELYHFGIPGMKWGRRNGPPYPLDKRDYSSAEKKAAGIKTKRIGGGSDESTPIRRLKSAQLNYLDQRKTQSQYNLKRSQYDKKEFIDKHELGKHNPYRLSNKAEIAINTAVLKHYEKRINRLLDKYEKRGFDVNRKQHTRFADMSADLNKYGPEFSSQIFQRYSDLSINKEGSIYVVKKRKKS